MNVYQNHVSLLTIEVITAKVMTNVLQVILNMRFINNITKKTYPVVFIVLI